MSAAPKPQPYLPAPVTFRNILFATDFSSCSELALRYAYALATRHGSKVYALHILPPEPRTMVPMDLPEELDTAREAASEHMLDLLQREPLQKVPHAALIEHGPVPDVLPSLLVQHDIDLVVIGTHGYHGIKKMVLGSTAEQIFRLAKCPVLTVGPAVSHNGIPEGEFPHILYATDFSPGSLHALPYALSLAKENHARLTMLHVISDVSEAGVQYLDEISAACKQRLTELLPPGAGQWCEPQFIAEVGPACDTILKTAEESEANLIVMGARRRRMIATSAHLPWHTAYGVASEAICPVLTVRS